MKIKKLRKIALLFLTSFICFTSCQYDENESITDNLDSNNSSSKTPLSCIYGDALSFASLDALQTEHKALYDAFEAGGGGDQVLEDYEISNNNFYSLRKKDYEMNEGIIPDDPNFDSFNYTTDNILETILNKDGMVIIDNYLYLWSDGAVIHRIPYSCPNYNRLLAYGNLVRFNPTNHLSIQNMKNKYMIEDIVIATDPRFDFESISESGRKMDNNIKYPVKSQKAGCGLQSVLNQKLKDYDTTTKKIVYRLKASTAAPVGLNPISTIILNNANAYNNVKIIGCSNSSLITPSNPIPYVPYVGDWVDIEVDFSNYTDINLAPDLNFSLTTVISLLSANSCFAADELFLSVKCPLSLSKEIINYSAGEFKFTIDGMQFFNTSGGYNILWNFGDGTSQTTTNTPTVFHTYNIPCLETSYNVTATITKITTLCKTNFSLDNAIIVGDPCKRQRAVTIKRYPVGGKKAKLVQKIRPRSSILGGGTVLKNKERLPLNGIKQISSAGFVYLAQGNNCVQQDVSSLLPNISQNGKKRLKQKYTSPGIYTIDVTMPYTTTFSHDNDLYQTLLFLQTCTH